MGLPRRLASLQQTPPATGVPSRELLARLRDTQLLITSLRKENRRQRNELEGLRGSCDGDREDRRYRGCNHPGRSLYRAASISKLEEKQTLFGIAARCSPLPRLRRIMENRVSSLDRRT